MHPTLIETLRRTDSDDYITESYLRRRVEAEGTDATAYKQGTQSICHQMAILLADICWGPHKPPSEMTHLNTDEWASKHGVFVGQDRTYWSIYINNRNYEPGGNVKRSPPTPRQSSGAASTGQFTTIRNGGQADEVHDANKSVELVDSRSSSLTRGFTFDLTAKESISEGGITAEAEEHLGISETDEITSDHSETVTDSFDDTVTVHGSVDSPPGGEELTIGYSKVRNTWDQTYTIRAVCDFAPNVLFHNWFNASSPNAAYLYNDANAGVFDWSERSIDSAKWPSIHDFLGFVRGFDPRAPHMARYWPAHASDAAKTAMAWLEEPSNRFLQLSGSASFVDDGDADYRIYDVSGVSDDDVHAILSAGNPMPQGNRLGG